MVEALRAELGARVDAGRDDPASGGVYAETVRPAGVPPGVTGVRRTPGAGQRALGDRRGAQRGYGEGQTKAEADDSMVHGGPPVAARCPVPSVLRSCTQRRAQSTSDFRNERDRGSVWISTCFRSFRKSFLADPSTVGRALQRMPPERRVLVQRHRRLPEWVGALFAAPVFGSARRASIFLAGHFQMPADPVCSYQPTPGSEPMPDPDYRRTPTTVGPRLPSDPDYRRAGTIGDENAMQPSTSNSQPATYSLVK